MAATPSRVPWQPRLADGESSPRSFAPEPLAAALAAVPAMLTEVAGWPSDLRAKAAEEAADVIAGGADALWLTDPQQIRRTEVSPDQVGTAITTGLAILAHRAGGVRFGGLHWHATPMACATCPGPGVWTASPEGTSRVTRGAVFTPRHLAEEVAAGALDVLLQPASPSGLAADIEGLRVADIACGSGAILLAACRHLADKLADAWDANERDTALDRYQTTDPAAAARALVASTCLFGVDIDPLSVALADLALQLLAPSIQPAGGRLPGLRVGDALIGRSHPRHDTVTGFPDTAARLDWPEAFPDVFAHPAAASCGYDAVITNPPWLGGLKLTGALGAACRNHLIDTVTGGMRGTADLAAYFWLRAHELVHDYGVVGIIGPHALLRGATARVGRDQLARRGWRPYRTVPARTWPTKSAAVSYCLVWTHRLGFADPPAELRDHEEPPPPGGVLVATITVDGAPYEIYRHPPNLREVAG